MSITKPRRVTGAFRTFYHFRRSMSNQAALKCIKEFIARERHEFQPDPLCMATRESMERYYDKEYQGD